MEIIIAGVIPNLGLTFNRFEQAQKQIYSVLLFSVRKCVTVVSTQRLHDIVALRGPRSCFPVSFDSVHQLGAAILQC